MNESPSPSPIAIEPHASATSDNLTGLASHREFYEQLSNLCGTDAILSLMIVELDRFKRYNAAQGYPAGDTFLREAAAVIRQCVRGEDFVARYGGDEFAVLLPGTDQDHALAVADRIRVAIEGIAAHGGRVTASVGVATSARSSHRGEELVQHAESAVAAAKAMGRNVVRHRRHLQQQRAASAMPLSTAVRAEPASLVAAGEGCAIDAERHACASSPAGCRKCEVVPETAMARKGRALLLAPQDDNAAATLQAALQQASIPSRRIGPLHVLAAGREQLPAVNAALVDGLSPYTRQCIRAAFTTAGVSGAEDALASMIFAEPLTSLIENLEYEWVREALADDWLFSVFHPILDARTGETMALEALVRARDPLVPSNVLGPGQIIGACERLNIQHQLDQRARRTAIRDGSRHLPAGDTKLFINFLPNTIYDPEICLRTTIAAAAENNIALSRLVFEVVETQKIPDMERLLRILNYYRERGVGTAIDDMGAGHTDIDYITQLRPDFVKLDREFMLDAEQHAAGRAKMADMVRASHAAGAKVIAEGIETPAQHAMCVAAGVDYVQGFLFAKPAVPPQAVRFVPPRPTNLAA